MPTQQKRFEKQRAIYEFGQTWNPEGFASKASIALPQFTRVYDHFLWASCMAQIIDIFVPAPSTRYFPGMNLTRASGK